jgi:hypothetical protein
MTAQLSGAVHCQNSSCFTVLFSRPKEAAEETG